MRCGLKNLIVVVLVGAAAFFLWMVHPEENGFIPRCLFLQGTGFHCPGCGSLRAIHYLLQGELAQAWAMNPLTVLLLPVLLVVASAELFFHRYDLAHRIRPRWIWLLLVVFLLLGVLRNLPVYPFSLLAPHHV
ncbi:MAG: DUF2752 domain-containing protein [Verrucomicrobia bacterium]|nr:DUF2752 domain-containing protein [Verrucomicrobiota bacterium]